MSFERYEKAREDEHTSDESEEMIECYCCGALSTKMYCSKKCYTKDMDEYKADWENED